MPSASAPRGRGGGDEFVLTRRRQPGLHAPPGRRVLAPASRTRTSVGSRSRCAGTTTASTWPSVRNMTGIPVCAGQSEISRAGCRDLMMSGAIDVCNFDASWGGGPTEWRRVAGTAMSLHRRDGPPRGAADIRAPARLDRPTAPIWKPFIRTATRCSMRWSRTARPSSRAATSCPRAGIRPGARREGHCEAPRVVVSFARQ